MEIISRKKALELDLKHYFTGKPCKYGHVSIRRTKDRHCLECKKNIQKNYRKNNPNKVKLSMKNWLDKPGNHDKKIKQMKEWRKDNPEKSRQSNLNWVRDNPERNKKIQQKSDKKFSSTNKGKLKKANKRVITRLNLGKNQNGKKYIVDYTAEEFSNYLLKNLPFNTLEEAYTENYHLDHIVPVSFISDNVFNKYCAFKICMDLQNLRLIPAKENISKGCKIYLPIVQETIKLLNKKYNVNMPLL